MSKLQKYGIFNRVFISIDHTLEPFDRFIFFRLWLLDQEIEKSDQLKLIDLVERLKVGRKKLKKSLVVLSKKGLVSLQQDDQIIINNLFDLPLSKKCQLFNFDRFLISNIDRCRYHHKQKAIENYWKLDYKSWLVLFLLILHSDKHGIILKVGMHEFNIHTGMDRYSVQRTINKLFSFGILRSKLNGTLDSEYLSFSSAIYFLNLSHPLWGENKRYQKFYFTSLPEKLYQMEKYLFLDKNELFYFKIIKNISNEIKTPILLRSIHSEEDIYIINNIFNIYLLHDSLKEIKKLKNSNLKSINLKNTNNEINNLNRLKFIFKYLAQFLNHKKHEEFKIASQNLGNYYSPSYKYLKINKFNPDIPYPDIATSCAELNDPNSPTWIQIELFAFMSYLLTRNEVFSLNLKEHSYCPSLTFPIPIPTINDQGFSGYVIPKKYDHNQLYKISLTEKENNFRRIEEELEMNIENQKKYGLLHSSCKELIF